MLRALPPRTDYYPGADQRLASVLEAHPQAETHGDGDCRIVVPDITDHDDMLITDEVFGSALGVVRLPGDTPAEFLRHAVDFANDKLPGTLGATLIVHPRTEKDHRAAVEQAVAGLRYGTLGVNCWSAIGFLLGYTPGAPTPATPARTSAAASASSTTPSCSRTSRRPCCAPLRPTPRGLFTGSPSLSPRPPYFVTNQTSRTTIERVTRFTAAPGIAKLAGRLRLRTARLTVPHSAPAPDTARLATRPRGATARGGRPGRARHQKRKASGESRRSPQPHRRHPRHAYRRRTRRPVADLHRTRHARRPGGRAAHRARRHPRRPGRRDAAQPAGVPRPVLRHAARRRPSSSR